MGFNRGMRLGVLLMLPFWIGVRLGSLLRRMFS